MQYIMAQSAPVPAREPTFSFIFPFITQEQLELLCKLTVKLRAGACLPLLVNTTFWGNLDFGWFFLQIFDLLVELSLIDGPT